MDALVEAHTPDQWQPADRRGETDKEDTGTHEEEKQVSEQVRIK